MQTHTFFLHHLTEVGYVFNMRVTMQQIATRTGVSIATVSRALANSSKVKPETVRRIRQVADELGYEPDPVLSSLNAYRWSLKSDQGYRSTLAWLTNYPTRDGWQEMPSNQYLFEALEMVAPTQGYRIEPFWVHPTEMPARRLDQILTSRGIRGIFLSILPDGEDTIEFPWESYAVLSLSESVQRPNVHSVHRSYLYNVKRSVAELAAAGYRKPVMIVHPRYHQGVHGVAEGAFFTSTREVLGEARPYVIGDVSRFSVLLRERMKMDPFDVVISSYRKDELQCVDGFIRKLPWVSINLTYMEPAHAGCYTSSETFARIALEQMTGMIQRGDTGVPNNPLSMRIQGEWIPLS